MVHGGATTTQDCYVLKLNTIGFMIRDAWNEYHDNILPAKRDKRIRDRDKRIVRQWGQPVELMEGVAAE